jgi:hypothetical protein
MGREWVNEVEQWFYYELVGLEFLINTQSNLNQVIIESFHGDIAEVSRIFNKQIFASPLALNRCKSLQAERAADNYALLIHSYIRK